MIDAEMPPVRLRIWVGFVMMCLGMFMAILDIQIVTTSLPTIQQALGIRPEQMSWIQTAYLTAEIVAIRLTGFLIARFGLRWLFVTAVVAFTLASAGCAESQGFASLIAWRVVQGFAGGTLIPAVFSAVFLLFPPRLQGTATMIAGVAAVLAPTVGPIVGGWLTATFTWHWLFRVNIVPGIVAAIGVAVAMRDIAHRVARHRAVDIVALLALAAGLTAFEIGMKDAPALGWLAPRVVILLAGFAACAAIFVVKSMRTGSPLVELRCFADRNFTIGCMLSFILGVGLFGATYLMPFFLGLVREHNALEIGEIMLVTGVAQLASAPLAVYLEQRVDARWLTAFGFAVFAVGLTLSSRQTADTDFHEMLVPQMLRGAAIMFLPVAAHAPGAGAVAHNAGGGRQRAIQPDAQHRRRGGPGVDRHDHLQPCGDLWQSDRRSIAARRRRDRRQYRYSARCLSRTGRHTARRFRDGDGAPAGRESRAGPCDQRCLVADRRADGDRVAPCSFRRPRGNRGSQ